LLQLANENILEEDRQGFFFHATDLHHGYKRTHRDRYSRPDRIRILRELCSIPNRFNIPVIAASVERAELARCHPDWTKHELTNIAQTIAAMSCTGGVEKFMRAHANPDEVAMLIYENNDNAKRLIRDAHNFMRTPESLNTAISGDWPMKHVLPFERIVDTAHFVEKTDACILQVADACAFAISRRLSNKDAEGYSSEIDDALTEKVKVGLSPSSVAQP
jgi:hypothetical protein